MRNLLGLALVFGVAFGAPVQAKVIHKGVVLDPSGLVRPALIESALIALKEKNGLRKDRMAVVDFSKHSREKRFFVIDLRTGGVEAYRTAHGRGSDSDHDGFAESFSNAPKSKASSLGAYAGRREYKGKYGTALELDGLDASNANALSRRIVLHSAEYASPAFLRTHGTLGRSFGCFVVDPKLIDHIVKELEGGVLIYAGR